MADTHAKQIKGNNARSRRQESSTLVPFVISNGYYKGITSKICFWTYNDVRVYGINNFKFCPENHGKGYQVHVLAVMCEEKFSQKNIFKKWVHFCFFQGIVFEINFNTNIMVSKL